MAKQSGALLTHHRSAKRIKPSEVWAQVKIFLSQVGKYRVKDPIIDKKSFRRQSPAVRRARGATQSWPYNDIIYEVFTRGPAEDPIIHPRTLLWNVFTAPHLPGPTPASNTNIIALFFDIIITNANWKARAD